MSTITRADIGISRWTAGPAMTRLSDSSFSVSDTSENQAAFCAARFIRYRSTGGTWRYGQVLSYSSGTVTLAGHPLTTSDDDEIQYGTPDVGRVVPLVFPGNCVVADPYMGLLFRWRFQRGYAIRSVWKADVAPSGATIAGNVEVNGADIHSSEINLNGTSEVDSGVNIAQANYDIQPGETYAVTISQVGSTEPGGNALSVDLIFVIPD